MNSVSSHDEMSGIFVTDDSSASSVTFGAVFAGGRFIAGGMYGATGARPGGVRSASAVRLAANRIRGDMVSPGPADRELPAPAPTPGRQDPPGVSASVGSVCVGIGGGGGIACGTPMCATHHCTAKRNAIIFLLTRNRDTAAPRRERRRVRCFGESGVFPRSTVSRNSSRILFFSRSTNESISAISNLYNSIESVLASRMSICRAKVAVGSNRSSVPFSSKGERGDTGTCAGVTGADCTTGGALLGELVSAGVIGEPPSRCTAAGGVVGVVKRAGGSTSGSEDK